MPIAEPISSLTRVNAGIKNILGSLFDLNDNEIEALTIILKKKGGCTTEEIADRMKKDSTTVTRYLKDVMEEGLIYRDKISGDEQGFYYLYQALPKEELINAIEDKIAEVKKGLDRVSKKIASGLDDLTKS